MHPDQKYIDALVTNDEKLLHELYQSCFPAIRNMVLQNNGSESHAADIFQEALIDLLRKAKTRPFVLTSSICAYIKGICRNKWYDELEKRKRVGVTFSSFEEQDIGEDCFRDLQDQQLKQARMDLIWRKFQQLGKGCKELLALSWTKNSMGKRRSTEELAEMLNMTNGYVRKKKSECIVRLIKLVMEDPEYGNLKQ